MNYQKCPKERNLILEIPFQTYIISPNNFSRILFIFLFFVTLIAKAGPYKTVILGLDSAKAKSVWMNSQQPNQTHYGVGEVMMADWTNGGQLTIRSLIWFDFSMLPAGGIIRSAKLNLYGYNSPSDGGTSNLSGDNSFKLYRTTNSWNPKTATWNNQPGYDTAGVYVSGANSKYNALNIDVTKQVKDMITKGNYGFLAKLNTEQYYRKVVFGSSFNADSTLRPKLVIEIEVPEVHFRCNTVMCLRDTLKCTDSSIAINQLSYSWDFGDNTTSSTKNPSHVYTKAGTYKVFLKVTTSTGAWDTISKYVKVNDRPVPSFSVNASTQCLTGNSFAFFNSTAGTGTISYKWDFGDGSTSTKASLAHSYLNAGVYKVVLTAVNSSVCLDTVSTKVTVSKVSPGFTILSPKQCLDGNSFKFTNTSTGVGIKSYNWDFGDGNTSDSANPVYSYPNPGTYKVLLTVKFGSGCRDTISSRVIVFPVPIALFSVNNKSQCISGQNFSFTGAGNVSSGNIISWQWNFGDKTGAITQNPSHTYSASGIYKVKLTITTDKGCVTSTTDSVRLNMPPTAGFTVNKSIQCISDQNFSFINTSTTSTDTLSYEWDFGDKTAIVSSQNPSHTYTKPGNFVVLLKTFSDQGCLDTFSKIVRVLPAPQAIISASGSTKFCQGDDVTLFTNQDTGYKYQWLKNGNKITGSIYASYIASQTGNYSVLIGNNTGCTDTSDAITIIVNPIPVQPVITQQGQVLFSAGGVKYKWFQNGTEISGATLPYYQPVIKKGVYSVMITDSNGCSNTSEDYIFDITGIEEPLNTEYVKVYPNPAQSVINIDLGNTTSGIRRLQITDINGRCVKTLDLKGATSIIEIPVQDYIKGIYFIQFTRKDTTFYRKVVIE